MNSGTTIENDKIDSKFEFNFQNVYFSSLNKSFNLQISNQQIYGIMLDPTNYLQLSQDVITHFQQDYVFSKGKILITIDNREIYDESTVPSLISAIDLDYKHHISDSDNTMTLKKKKKWLKKKNNKILKSASKHQSKKNIPNIDIYKLDFKEQIKKVTQILDLDFMLKDKVKTLQEGEYLRLLIAYNILHERPSLLFLSIPPGILTYIEKRRLLDALQQIPSELHIGICLFGLPNDLQPIEQIIYLGKGRISSKLAKKDINQILLENRYQDEVILLRIPDIVMDELDTLKNITSTKVIYQKQRDQIKIFSKNPLDEIIIKIFKLLGPKIFHFKRKKPLLEDYLTFINNR